MFLEKSRERIEREFEIFCRELPRAAWKILRYLEHADGDTALALKYLYANMPVSDAGNYSFETFLDYARHGVFLWENSPYRERMPEDIFLNYVLFHRVNEEEIKPCRSFFYEKLAGLDAGKRFGEGISMEKAALEVNYWCAGEMTYQATDGRTAAAMDAYERGFGRCGEESVFAVNALRSVGLPARQVYAMRWSHCDDNHAWVEVWCDGEWHYLGACEPEAVLDKGWFTNAASRAMMIGSRWFDRKEPDEEVLGRDGMNRMLNQLERYGETRRLHVLVKDGDGRPVSGARVSGEVLNYAEFFPVLTVETGEDGYASFVTGLGSLHIRAAFQGRMGECLADTREKDRAVCVLGEEIPMNVWKDFDIIAPVDRDGRKRRTGTEQPAETEPAGNAGEESARAETEEENNRRVAEASARCRRKRENFRPLWRQDYFGLGEELAEKLMSFLSEKDRMDADPEIIKEHWEEAAVYEGKYSEDIFFPYIWCPRVEDEILTSWRRGILRYFSPGIQEDFRSDPGKIWSWIQEHIVSMDDRERLSIITAPLAALKLGIAGERSRKVLFVAIARTLGVPARRNPADGEAEYWDGGSFCPVRKGRQKTARLVIEGASGTSWKYFQNWSIARREGEGYHTLHLRDFSAGEKSGTVLAEPGDYRILTANRLPTGNLFARQYDFHISAGETRSVFLTLRQATLKDMLDSHTIPDYSVKREKGGTAFLSEITEGRRKILFWLETGKEPTEHILNEILDLREEFGSCQDQLAFFLAGPDSGEYAVLKKCREHLPGVEIYYDSFGGKPVEMIARRMYVDPEKLPLLVVTDGKLNGIFAASGYSVGMAELLLRILRS